LGFGSEYLIWGVVTKAFSGAVVEAFDGPIEPIPIARPANSSL